jgi:hypothetical protein
MGLLGVNAGIPYCGARVLSKAAQCLILELAEPQVRGAPDKPRTQPTWGGAVVSRDRQFSDDAGRQCGRGEGIPAPRLSAADVPVQHGWNIAVTGELDVHGIDVGECARILRGSMQHPWFVQVLRQPANRRGMLLTRLALLASAKPPFVALMQAQSHHGKCGHRPGAVAGQE